MSWVQVAFTVRTPLISGQPRPERDAAAEVVSLKGLRGALEFWFRALVGSRVGNDLDELARLQAQVFGTARGGGRASAIALRWGAEPPRCPARSRATTHPDWLFNAVTENGTKVHKPRYGVLYLAGPGVADRRAGMSPPWLSRGDTFTIEVKAVKAQTGGLDPQEWLFAALWLLRHYGALGARGRRGFGNVDIALADGVEPTWWHNPPTLDTDSAVPHALGLLLDSIPLRPDRLSSVPTYPRFGTYAQGATVLRGATDLTSLRSPNGHRHVKYALNELGQLWRAFRADVPNGGFDETTEWQSVIKPRTPSTTHFPLGILGLPIVFAQGNSKTVNLTTNDETLRLASPFHLRLTPANDGMTTSVTTTTFVHALRPTNATMTRTPDLPLTGLDPAVIPVIHQAWTAFTAGATSTWRTAIPGRTVAP